MLRRCAIIFSLTAATTAAHGEEAASKDLKPAEAKDSKPAEAEDSKPAEAKDSKPAEAKEAKPEEAEAGFLDSLTYQRSSSVSVLAVQGAKNSGFRPSRDLRLTDKSKVVSGQDSLVWNLRFEVNRYAFTEGKQNDEPFADHTVTLPNGSVIGRDRAFIVQEAYLQHLSEHWMVQVGDQLFAWGSADSVNPTSVFNPQDLRSGFLGDKETKIAPTPAVRLALLGEGQTLNFVYAPWRSASLMPGPAQNWYLAPSNLSFNVQVVPDQHVEDRGSYAIKYDKTIAEGDLSFLYYEGADYDVDLLPAELLVVNNQPLTVSLVQVVPEKTAYGASYSQTFGKWVLKAESLYTPNKQAIPDVDRSQIETVSFPLALKKTGYIQGTAGFNYFTPINNFFGLPLGDTVLTAEYYKAHYTAGGLMAPSLSDLVIGNLRTSTMEDRLEIYLTYGVDPVKDGRTWSSKLVYNGEKFRHNLVYAGFDGSVPAANQTGSVFYYWRNNNLVSYELVYPF